MPVFKSPTLEERAFLLLGVTGRVEIRADRIERSWMHRFIGRLKTNNVLERMARPHLQRPVGRPPKEGYEKIVELGEYQAEGGATHSA